MTALPAFLCSRLRTITPLAPKTQTPIAETEAAKTQAKQRSLEAVPRRLPNFGRGLCLEARFTKANSKRPQAQAETGRRAAMAHGLVFPPSASPALPNFQAARVLPRLAAVRRMAPASRKSRIETAVALRMGCRPRGFCGTKTRRRRV